jgi:hypothetical protein
MSQSRKSSGAVQWSASSFRLQPPNSFVIALFGAGRRIPVVATVSVSQEGVVIGHIKFVLQIERRASMSEDPQRTGQATRYQTAFISYAWQNREVYPIVKTIFGAT